MKSLLSMAVLAGMLMGVTGCATVGGSTGATYTPVIDFKVSKHPENYNRDIVECRELAKSVEGPGMAGVKGALGGGAVGAAAGAAGGAIAGVPGTGAAAGALLGIPAGAWAAYSADEKQKIALRQCMRGRGYWVLQ
jgi:hypothetical protein